jgi:hypothetical protein
MNENATTRITKVEAVALPVTDQDRAVEFYLGKLGFENGAMCRSGRACAGSRSHHRER